MKFAEIFEKYKQGIASEEEIKFIEEELEKNELINEYFGEQLTFDIPNITEQRDTKEIRKINKAVNKRLWSRIVIALVVVASVIAGIYFACQKFFYNPDETAKGIPDIRETVEYDDGSATYGYSPLFLNVTAFAELYCPGLMLNSVTIEESGFGTYDIWINYNSFDETKEYTTQIKRGNNVVRNHLFFEPIPSGVFYEAGPHNSSWEDEAGVRHYEQMEDERKMNHDELQLLPKSSYISAYISFENDITVQEFIEFRNGLEGCSDRWVAVRTSDEKNFNLMGFDVSHSGMVIDTTENFEKIFPAFSLVGKYGNLSDEQLAETYETHFKTILKYMSQQETFLKTFCDVNRYSDMEEYENALAYVEEKGVNVLGAYVTGRRDEMIELEQMEGIASFRIDDVKLSIFE